MSLLLIAKSLTLRYNNDNQKDDCFPNWWQHFGNKKSASPKDMDK
jgi:hypothetical protein